MAPAPLVWLLALAAWLAWMAATFAPLWLASRFDLISKDDGDEVLFWKLSALVAYYTLLGLAAAWLSLRRAWLTWRSDRHPFPGQFVIRRQPVRYGGWAKFQALGYLMAGLLILGGVGAAWHAMQVPAVIFGIGEYRPDASADCPPGTGEASRD